MSTLNGVASAPAHCVLHFKFGSLYLCSLGREADGMKHMRKMRNPYAVVVSRIARGMHVSCLRFLCLTPHPGVGGNQRVFSCEVGLNRNNTLS